MVTLRNHAKCSLGVRDGDVNVTILPGHTVELNTQTNFDDHIFVLEGWLEVVKPAASEPEKKPVRKPKAKKD